MAKENNFPGWFVWTTTSGLVIVILLLWFNYSATTDLARTNYGMMQANAKINMMNSGMMRMMASSMMKNNLMNQSDFEKIDKLYNSSLGMGENMQSMMNNGNIDSSELNQMMQNGANARNMMGGMMR